MNKKFPLQICQDEEITKKFRNLHTELVNKVISFCKENNKQVHGNHVQIQHFQLLNLQMNIRML